MSKTTYRVAVHAAAEWLKENLEQYYRFSANMRDGMQEYYGDDFQLVNIYPSGIVCLIRTEAAEDRLGKEVRGFVKACGVSPELAGSSNLRIRILNTGMPEAEPGDYSRDEEPSGTRERISPDEIRERVRKRAEENRLKKQEEARRRQLSEMEQEENKQEEELRNRSLADIDDMVGAEEFKALCHDLDGELLIAKKTGSLPVFRKTCFLFAIDDGNGLTHAVKMFIEFMAFRDVIRMTEAPEGFTLPEPNPKELENQLKQSWGQILSTSDKKGLFLLDISRWTGRTGTPVFRKFLLNIVREWPMGMLIIRVPLMMKKQYRAVLENLSDVLVVRPVVFPPFEEEQQHVLAQKVFSRYGFKADESVWPVFDRKMLEEAADGITHGIHTYRKVVQEMILAAQRSPLFKKRTDPVTGEMVAAVLDSGYEEKAGDAFSELNRLVGLSEVKMMLPIIAKQIELSRKSGRRGGAALHMRFDGNPGTGKTTVARLLGRLLAQMGVLRRSRIVEKMGRDLCGIYIGETARITKSICEEAYGTILFIDEAYSLYRGKEDSNDFGREAMDVLITEMENHRDDLIVILAGYEKQMDHMFSGNPGLKSRVSYHIHFPNYSREELAEIFFNLMENDGVRAEDGLREAVGEFFSRIPEEAFRSPDFGNARLVRNIYQQAYGIAALRLNVGRMEDILISPEDFKKAAGLCRRQIPGMEKDAEFSKIGFID